MLFFEESFFDDFFFEENYLGSYFGIFLRRIFILLLSAGTLVSAMGRKRKDPDSDPKLTNDEKNLLIEEVSLRETIWNANDENHKKTSVTNKLFDEVAEAMGNGSRTFEGNSLTPITCGNLSFQVHR
jgi:hypothetical protein